MSYLYNKNVNVQNNNVAVTTTNPFPITGTVETRQAEGGFSLVKYIDEENTQLDSVGRLRVVTPTQQWWYTASVDADTNLRYSANTRGAGANVVYVNHIAGVELASGTDSNGSVIRASRRRHKVRPGVSHEWRSQINWDGADPTGNVVKRSGMFTNFNGMFFEVSDDLYIVVRRRLIDGTLTETRVSRNNFTYDTMSSNTGSTNLDFNTTVQEGLTGHVSTSNVGIKIQNGLQANVNVYNVVFSTANDLSSVFTAGQKVMVSGVTPNTFNGSAMVSSVNGASKRITLTYTKNPGTYSSISSGKLLHNAFLDHHAWFFDFSGGRSSRIRFGVDTVGGPKVLHIINFTGQLGSPFESAPALMERAEIMNGGIVNYSPTMSITGVTFNVEASADLNPGFSIARNNAKIPFTKNAGQEYPIIGIALREGEPYQRADIQLQSVEIADAGNVSPQNAGLYYWRLLLNPIIGGTVPTPTNIGKTSRQWAYTTSTTVSGGIEMLSGYASSATVADTTTALNFLNMGSNIDYTDSDKLVLVVQEISGGTADGQIVASMNFIEDL